MDSEKSYTTINTQSQYTPYVESEKMRELHSEFKAVTAGSSNPQKFQKRAQELGYNPTNKIMKVLNDPEPKFKNIVKNLGKFQKSTKQERIASQYAGMYGRYPRRGPAKMGKCRDQKLGALQDFQRGNIDSRQLKKKLGGNMKSLKKDIERFEDGDFRKVATKIMRNEQIRAERLNGPQNSDPIMFDDVNNCIGKPFRKKNFLFFFV